MIRNEIQKKWNKFISEQAEEEMNSAGQAGLVHDAIEALPKDIKRVLCVGCGDGYECSKLAEKGLRVTGITLNFDAIKRHLRPGWMLEKMDMHDMSYSKGYFDLVFCKDVFEHAISHILALTEMTRVTKKYVFISIPDLGKELKEAGKWHYLVPTPDQMKLLAKRVGLEVVKYDINDAHKEGFGIHHQFLFKKK